MTILFGVRILPQMVLLIVVSFALMIGNQLFLSKTKIGAAGLKSGFWGIPILERYLISNPKLAFSVVKGVVPETTRMAVSWLCRLSARLP